MEPKLNFLRKRATKSKSMIDVRVNEDLYNMLCGRIAVVASRALADIHAHHADIGPDVIRLRDFAKPRSDDNLGELKREKKLLFYSRWEFYLFAFAILGVCVLNALDSMLPTYEYLGNVLTKVLWKVVPFISMVVWGECNAGGRKKEKEKLDNIVKTATWIKKAANLVYKILDEDRLKTLCVIMT